MSEVDDRSAEADRVLRAMVPGMLVLVGVAIVALLVGGSDVLGQSAGVWLFTVAASFILSGHACLVLPLLARGPLALVIALAFLGGSAVFLSVIVFEVALSPTYPSTAKGHQHSVFPAWLQASVPIILASITSIRLCRTMRANA